MNNIELAKSIESASSVSAVQSSVNSDTRLLLSSINAITKIVGNLTLVGHKEGPTSIDVQNGLDDIFVSQQQLDALVHFVFDCRYGWSERTSDTNGHTLEPPAMSMHSPARSGGAAARKRVMMGSVSAQSKKKTLNDAADAMIDVLFELPPSCRILLALQNCTRITTKPVVRQQALVHFYSWLKHYLRTRSITKSRREIIQSTSSLNQDLHTLVPPAINTSLSSSPTTATATATATATTNKGDEMSKQEYECAVRLVILSLTDVWSAIRKASSAHLYSVVDLFPLDQVRKLFEELCDICNGNKSMSQQQRSGSPTNANSNSSKATATNFSSSSVSSSSFCKTSPDVPSPWQGKNGALMGITVIIKKFRRQTRSTTHRKHPSPTTAWLAAVEDGNSPTDSNIKKSAFSPKSLSLNLLAIDASDSSPPASPAGRAQRFTDWGSTTTNLGLGLPSNVENSLAPSLPSVTTAITPTSSRSNASTTSTTFNTANVQHNHQQHQQHQQHQHDQNISPLGQHHGGSILMFGMAYQCDGLPDFICRAIHGVTFNLIGHEQLSVRENATRAFAAFLSRCPAHQTINAFSDVIDRLHRSFQSSLRSERDAYLAEGLLGLCVILAKLRLIPSNYMISNWDHIYSTLEGYLGHPASTVRQMSSTVFKHLAFRASKGMSGLGAEGNGKSSLSSSRGEDKESYLLLVAILRRLVFRWSVQSNLHTHVEIPKGGVRGSKTEDNDTDEDGEEELPWQSLEGRLLVYELLVGHLLANHRHFLTLDMSSRPGPFGSSSPGSGPPRRASVHGMIATNSEPKIMNELRSPTISEDSTESNEQTNTLRKRSGSAPDLSPLPNPALLSTPARPTGSRRAGKITPGDVMSPIVPPSPALSLAAIGSVNGNNGSNGTSNNNNNNSGNGVIKGENNGSGNNSNSNNRRGSAESTTSNRSSIGGGSSVTSGERGRGRDLELQSIVTTLQKATEATLDTSSIFWRVHSVESTETSKDSTPSISTSTTSSMSVSDAFNAVLQMMLLQTKECLISKKFELRRMADQVLKPLSELMFYYDPSTMGGHWSHVSEWLAAKDTLSCRFAAETMLCCIKHSLSLSSYSQPPQQQESSIFDPDDSASLGSSGGTIVMDTLGTNVQFWSQRHSEQRDCLVNTLQLGIPALHNLAKKATSERLAAAIFELMVVVHSLFEDNDNVTTGETLTLPDRAMNTSPSTVLTLSYPKDSICQHLDIVLERVINIHELANNVVRINKNEETKTTKTKAAALRKRRRAITLDPALAVALIPHLSTLLSNTNTTITQQLRLLPIVLRWTLTCDAVDARVSLLDTMLDVVSTLNFSENENDRSNVDLLMSSVEPLCQLVNKSLEAPVLGSVLNVVLGMTLVLPKEKDVPIFLSKVLPCVAKRLKQAAPQSVSVRARRGSTVERAKKALRMQWMSNEVDHQDPPPNLSESDSEDEDETGGGDDWDKDSEDDDDDWDDWDEEGSAETGNDLISSVLGSFVVRLESKGDFSLQDFSLIDDSDFEALQWYSCM